MEESLAKTFKSDQKKGKNLKCDKKLACLDMETH